MANLGLNIIALHDPANLTAKFSSIFNCRRRIALSSETSWAAALYDTTGTVRLPDSSDDEQGIVGQDKIHMTKDGVFTYSESLIGTGYYVKVYTRAFEPRYADPGFSVEVFNSADYWFRMVDLTGATDDIDR
jgi:hypothetical protein